MIIGYKRIFFERLELRYSSSQVPSQKQIFRKLNYSHINIITMKEIIPRNSHDLFHNMKSNDFVRIS